VFLLLWRLPLRCLVVILHFFLVWGPSARSGNALSLPQVLFADSYIAHANLKNKETPRVSTRDFPYNTR
jgi:hypothetical protein